MSAKPTMDPSRLAAFADGELSPEEAAAVVMHLADHPEDQAYVDNLMAANEALLQAFSEPLGEPVPGEIKNVILGEAQTAKIIPFRKRSAVWISTAVAAMLALGVFSGPDLFAPVAAPNLTLGPIDSGSNLATALSRLPSGVPESSGTDQEFMILATLPISDGYCREFEVINRAKQRIDLGIACITSDSWVVEVTMSEPLSASGTEDGFVTASGTEMQGLMPFLDRLGAGASLAPDAEADLIANGWMP